jgi:hypothetical protein
MGIVTGRTDMLQSCIDACQSCTQACYECLNECLNEPDLSARKDCVSMLFECAKICEMATATMAMGGQFAKQYCDLCATVCDKCADECNMFKDDHCKKCAETCHACASECRKMGTI